MVPSGHLATSPHHQVMSPSVYEGKDNDQFISPFKEEEQPKKLQKTEYFSLKDGEYAMST